MQEGSRIGRDILVKDDEGGAEGAYRAQPGWRICQAQINMRSGSMTGRSTFVTTLQDGSQQLGYNLAVHVPGGLIRQVSSWISLFTSDTFRFVQTTPNA